MKYVHHLLTIVNVQLLLTSISSTGPTMIKPKMKRTWQILNSQWPRGLHKGPQLIHARYEQLGPLGASIKTIQNPWLFRHIWFSATSSMTTNLNWIHFTNIQTLRAATNLINLTSGPPDAQHPPCHASPAAAPQRGESSAARWTSESRPRYWTCNVTVSSSYPSCSKLSQNPLPITNQVTNQLGRGNSGLPCLFCLPRQVIPTTNSLQPVPSRKPITAPHPLATMHG